MDNEELEVRVAQRTEQLASANKEWHKTQEDMKRKQSRLVLSEKLAALAELVAGIAHEINTPVVWRCLLGLPCQRLH